MTALKLLNICAMHKPKNIHYQTFGPITNFYGYVIHLAIVDDLFITKVFTPYKKKQIRYFYSEDTLTEYINLINDDRRF